MKKYFIFGSLLCVFLISCSSKRNINDIPESKEARSHQDLGKGEFKGLEYGWDIDFEALEGSITDLALSSNLAMLIGDAILQEHFGKSVLENELIGREIKGGQYYLVSRIPSGDVLGGDYNVVINKEDGKILKVWMGE